MGAFAHEVTPQALQVSSKSGMYSLAKLLQQRSNFVFFIGAFPA
jgi:hypothetical protein